MTNNQIAKENNKGTKVTNHCNINRCIEISLISNTPILIVSKPEFIVDVEAMKSSLTFVNFANSTNFKEALKVEYYNRSNNNHILEKWGDVFNRVDKAKKFYTGNTKINNISAQLLNSAATKLNLLDIQIALIKNIAIDIAKLDNSRNIEIHHVAEAIQYQAIDVESYIQSIQYEIEYLTKILNDLK